MLKFIKPLHLLSITALFGAYTLEFGTISLLPIFTNRLNLSMLTDGVSMALVALPVAIVGPILGLLGSKICEKKIIAVLAFVLAAANIMVAFATDLSLLMTARLLIVLIHPMLFPMIIATLASGHSENEKSLIVGSGIIGAIVGLALSVPFVTYVAHNLPYTSSLIIFAILDALTGLTLLKAGDRISLVRVCNKIS